ncbi:B12-binding domain-containing radical SAM protein [Sorangium sp. So ce542]|uniref:B12-binding domain-containing radical SAM protein n=1 Tax=Sorangium sp. So ce542 TaxID=3133316 RepID=UPI003F5DDD8F
MPKHGSSSRAGKRGVALVATPLGGPAARVHPIGAMTVASYVQSELGDEIDAKVFNFGSSPASRERALDVISAFRPEVLGFPVYSGHVVEVAEWAKLFRERLPEAVFVAGGPHVTLTWPDFIARWGGVFDLCIAGDGELPFLAAVEATLEGDVSRCWGEPGIGRRGDDGPIMNGMAAQLPTERWVDPFLCEVVEDGEELVFTDRRDRRMRRAVALVSSRSCPQKCSFCAIIAMPGKWRAAPTERLVGWLAGRRDRDPFDHIYFMDANFFVSAPRVRELVSAMAERLPGVTWSTSSTVGFLLHMADEIPWLIERGLRGVELGLESGSAEELRFLNKRATVDENHRAVALLQQHRLELGLDFIMFYPDQTRAQLLENLEFLQRAALLDEEMFDHYLTVLQLYPGTPLRTLYEGRRGSRFDPDELPGPEPLFVDEHVRSIHRLFIKEFAPRYLPKITATVRALQREARALKLTDPPAAQRCRLEATLLRHVPFKVLWHLCVSEPASSIEEAWPWLTRFDGSSESIRGLAAIQPTRAQGRELAAIQPARAQGMNR